MTEGGNTFRRAPRDGLADLLDATASFSRRYVVFGSDAQVSAVALWTAHTYSFECGPATPYLYPHSPEPGSGKTTLLEVLGVTAANAIQVDNLTEAVLFRLIDTKQPTLLIDEVDAIFGRKNSDLSEGIRQVLNSGYRKGKHAYRCVPPSHNVVAFNVYCPKAMAGLNQLPGTLAHRSIPIGLKPPRPEELYEELDYEEAVTAAEPLTADLSAWATAADGTLRDPRLKPAKLPELDARGNEIWRPLFRIADLAGGDWPDRARHAAGALSGRGHRSDNASTGIQLLRDIREEFDGERMTCTALAQALNSSELLPYGGWNDGNGLTTRELGRKLAAYGVKAKPVRIDGTRAGNGYDRDQFEDPWSRYLPGDDPSKQYSGTNGATKRNAVDHEPVHQPPVPVRLDHAKRGEKRDVPVVPVVDPVDRSRNHNPPSPLGAEIGTCIRCGAGVGDNEWTFGAWDGRHWQFSGRTLPGATQLGAVRPLLCCDCAVRAKYGLIHPPAPDSSNDSRQ
jgi:hypothetical protein